jgi:hypothetical protein
VDQPKNSKKGGATWENPFADGNPNLEVPLPLCTVEDKVAQHSRSEAMRQMIWRQLAGMETSSLWRASFGDYSLLAWRLRSGCELTAAERHLAADLCEPQQDSAWQANLNKWKNSVFAVVKFVLEHEAATGKRATGKREAAVKEAQEKFGLSRSTIFEYLAKLEKKGRVLANDRKEELELHGTLDAFVAEKWAADHWDDGAIIAAAVGKFGVDRDEADLTLQNFVSEFIFDLEPSSADLEPSPDYNSEDDD